MTKLPILHDGKRNSIEPLPVESLFVPDGTPDGYAVIVQNGDVVWAAQSGGSGGGGGATGNLFQETLAVTALNTLAQLTFMPVPGTVELFVNHTSHLVGAAFGITVTGKQVTWNAAAKPHPLKADGRFLVQVRYRTLDDISVVPTIINVAPSSGTHNTTLVITGTNFLGSVTVTIDGQNVVPNGVTPTQIVLDAPYFPTNGVKPIVITTNTGSATWNAWAYSVPPPIITSFTPTSAMQGETVTITGTSLLNASSVTIGGTPATITSNTATQIEVTVGTGSTGVIEVTTAGGTATSTATFTFTTAVVLPFPNAYVVPPRLLSAATGTVSGVTYTARASSEASYAPAWYAFDSNAATFWLATTAAPAWIELEASVAFAVREFTMQRYSVIQHAPRDFRLMVANTHSPSGAGYSTVFTRVGETWSSGTVLTVTIPTPQTGRIIRLQIDETQTSGWSPVLLSIALAP